MSGRVNLYPKEMRTKLSLSQVTYKSHLHSQGKYVMKKIIDTALIGNSACAIRTPQATLTESCLPITPPDPTVRLQSQLSTIQ